MPPCQPELSEEPVYVAPAHWDYANYALEGEAGERRKFFGRRDEMEVVVRMLVRHYLVDPERARAIVWSQPGAVESMRNKGRPSKPHEIWAADLADQMKFEGRQVRWDVVHRHLVALNEPQE